MKLRVFLLLLFCSLFAVCVSAQEIISVVRCDCRNGWSTVYLSNGDLLEPAFGKSWKLGHPEEYDITTDLVHGRKYAEGTLVQKIGKLYRLVNLRKVGQYTIDRIRIHEITAEQAETMSGDFTYKRYAWSGKAKGQIKSSSSGGSRTIVNIYFTNGKHATIEASKEPIWLDAEKGMQVEHYQWGNDNVYNLL